jgi:hypothetical protein
MEDYHVRSGKRFLAKNQPSLTMSAVSSTFLSTLRQALKEERHFALVEICQAKLGLAGRALTFVHNTTGNTQNVYMPSAVLAYAWSRDGKKFAITRARYNDSDVVMFSGFR